MHSGSKRQYLALTALPLLITGIACSDKATDSRATGHVESKVVCGEDNRFEPYAYPNSTWAESAKGFSVALVQSGAIDTTNPNDVRFNAPLLGDNHDLCPDQRFREQQEVAFCSGTLIEDDLVLTAGHCMQWEDACANTRFVFNWRMEESGSSATIKLAEDVYSCQSVLVSKDDWQEEYLDYAIVRLDRPVPRTPAHVSFAANPLKLGRELVLVGYPSGVPLKIAGGGTARISFFENNPAFFKANIDAFPSNSGSGIFAKDTGELVGIDAIGPGKDYVVSTSQLSCNEVFRKPDVDPAGWSWAPYAFRAIEHLCSSVGHPRLCHCGDGSCDPGLRETTASCPADCGSSCGDTECNGSETADNCYGDCGACGNGVCEPEEANTGSCCTDCGCAAGSLCSNQACTPMLGNVDGDDGIDTDDATAIATRATGAIPPGFHAEAADVNCDGSITSTDALLVAQRAEGVIQRFPCERVVDAVGDAGHTCVLFGSGNLRCFGDGYEGRLGYGNINSIGDDEVAAAAPYVPVGGRVKQVAASNRRVCALLEGGNVRCWGENAYGALGYGHKNTIGDDEPASAGGNVDVGGPVVQIAMGGASTCALLQTGNVRCWGGGPETGYGNNQYIGDDETPASAGDVPMGGLVTRLFGGSSHYCALLASGSLRCWGYNSNGQLGYGHTQDIGDDETPASAGDVPLGVGVTVKQVAIGGTHTCVLLAKNGNTGVKCWGTDFSGALGYPDRCRLGDEPAEVPALLDEVAVGEPVKELVGGSAHTCVLLEGGRVRCWGSALLGALGYGDWNSVGYDEPIRADDVNVGAPVASIRAFGAQTCALLTNGNIRCWGRNMSGELGLGYLTEEHHPGACQCPGATPELVPALVGDIPVIYPLSPR